MNTYFTGEQLEPFYPAVLLLITSIILFKTGREKISLLLLFCGTLFLGTGMALLDPYLVLWDEQFHALVAKNMAEHPFTPMLYKNPVIQLDYRNWTLNQLWLHKQPLFLWQMAIFIKLFGANVMGVRFASVLMHAFIPIMIYQIGKITVNARAGFYSALFFATAFYPLELICGRYETDHNDMAFLFYITGSFWSWIQFMHSKERKWLLITGIFSGGAVLVKWLTGLLVFACWIIQILLDKKQRNVITEYKNWLTAFITAIIVFLPWQVYACISFPKEYWYEFTLTARHFTETIEEHGGPWWYHFSQVKNIYGRGQLVPVLIVGSLILYLTQIKNNYRVFLISAIVLIYSYFSIAATKMPSYSIILCPIIFLGLGTMTDTAMKAIGQRLIIPAKYRITSFFPLLRIAVIITICILLLDPGRIEVNHTYKKPKDNYQREKWMNQLALIKKIPIQIPDNNCVIFNCPQYMAIPVIFFTGITAYDFPPSLEQLQMVKGKGVKIAVYDSGELPEWIKSKTDYILPK